MPLDNRVLTALERNPYLARRNLRFETEAGRVTLRGVVNTYFQKQMAQSHSVTLTECMKSPTNWKSAGCNFPRKKGNLPRFSSVSAVAAEAGSP